MNEFQIVGIFFQKNLNGFIVKSIFGFIFEHYVVGINN